MEDNNLPKGWEWKKLGDICDVKKGTSITKAKVIDGNIPVIAGGQQPAYFHNVSNRDGCTITVSASGAYAGFINYFETSIFASDCTTIQSNDENKLLTRFVYLMLKSQQKKIYDLQTGAGQPHVYSRDLVKIEIPIPPLPIQQKIVSILERAESLKQKREQVNEETNTIIQSIFYEMFGDPQTNPMNWKIKTIENSCKVQSGGTPSRKIKEYWNNGSIPWVGSTVCKNSLISTYEECITEEGLKNSATKWFDVDTVLIALVGATIGKTGLLKIRATTNQNIAGIYPSNTDELNSIYLFYAIQQLYPKFIALSNDSFKMANLSFIKSLEIAIPPISLQNQFASIVEKIESIKQKQNQATAEINTLFDALMQKAFNGEIRI